MSDRADRPRPLRVLQAVAEVLEDVGVPWAVIGGLAVSVRVEPRFTRGIDLAVAVDDDAGAERLVQELTSHGGTEAGVVVDLLLASSGIEPEISRSKSCGKALEVELNRWLHP